MNISKIIGVEGGHDGCYFKILQEAGRGKTKYYPSIDTNGEELSPTGPKGFDYYCSHKVERERDTIRVTVAGNPCCAEDVIKNILGCKCLACGPTSVDIYPQEVI